MTLAFEEYPNPGAPRLVLVHGFTQNARCWGPLPHRLQRWFHVVAVDAPGHGVSPPAHDDASMAEAAQLIAEVGGRAGYLGYSMGGRLCLQLACDHPGLVEHLVLVGATAGLTDPVARDARRRSDDELAATIERDGLDAFLERWLALPLFAGLPDDARAMAQRRTNRAAGLAASLRAVGTGSQTPLHRRLAALPMAVLAVAGALDTKFVAEAETIIAARAHPGGSAVATIEGAGHTAHLERPEAFLPVVEAWWRSIGALAPAG